MANPCPGTRSTGTPRQKNIGEKLWDLICCNCSSTRSPIEAIPRLDELELKPRNEESTSVNINHDDLPTNSSPLIGADYVSSAIPLQAIVHPEGEQSASSSDLRQSGTDGKFEDRVFISKAEDSTRKEDYSDVIDTADSIVNFVLNAVQSVGSSLPGIGVVSIVLAAKDKFMTDRANRKEMEKILKYIEELCEDARTVEGTETPVIDTNNAQFIESLRNGFGKQEISTGWRRALEIINADSRKEDIEAVWKGIERAMKRRGLKATVNPARLIENVFKRMLEMSMTLNVVRSDQLVQMTKDEVKAMDDLLRSLSIAKGAKFNSMRTEQTRLVTCTTETRVKVLDTIQGWATSEENGRQHLFWLNGLAGTGKSTIASTIAKWADGEKLLGGSFFFSRSVPELSSPERVFSTLAFQLSEFDKEYKCSLYHVLRGDQLAANANLEVQFDTFIRKPFSLCREKRAILIMLDALDECSPEEDVKRMLRLLLQYDDVESGGTRLRIFITSRPESHIRLVFTSRDGSNRHEKVVLHDIDKGTVRKDIEKYLTAEFGKISSGDFERKPPKDWPSSSDFEKVHNNCGEFFAYAATVVRFIGDTNIGDPNSQLADILQMMDNPSMTASMNPYIALDNLYLSVLEQAARRDPREGSVARIVHVIATVICLRRPMSVRRLALFLGMTLDDVRYTLRHLHSVILVPDRTDRTDDQVNITSLFKDTVSTDDIALSHFAAIIGGDPTPNVQFFHQSFPDFLTDQKRCPSDKGFLVDTAVHHACMASRCIDLNSLTGVARYGLVLRYAFKHWMSHFQLGRCPDAGGPSEEGSLWPIITGDELTEEIARLEREPQAEFSKPWSEKTRKAVLDVIRDWYTSRGEHSAPMFWLYGWTDRGHPSVGMYIAKWARDLRIPGAYIFFDVTWGLNMKFVFPFLASQLARFSAEYRCALYNIIQRDKGILSSNDYRAQFETLIHQPMALSIPHEKAMQPILVLNAYEHHESPNLYGNKLHFLRTSLHLVTSTSMGSTLRVLVVSKPHASFFALLNSRSHKPPVVLHEFDEHMDRDDIRALLERWLQDHGEALSDEQLEKLLRCCGTSFTFARTAIRFLFDKKLGDPTGQLREILNIKERLSTAADESRRHLELDELYRLILLRVASKYPLEEDIVRARCFIASMICVPRSGVTLISSHTLEKFLSVEEDNIRAIRHLLNCVGDNAKDNLLGFLHPSFEQFIQDKERCTDSRFLVDVSAHECFMILRCCSDFRARLDETSIHMHPGYYLVAHWPLHLRSAMYHDLNGDLTQELDLTGMLIDKEILRISYLHQAKSEKILLGEDVDIIPFVRELVEKCQLKEAERILPLLRDAEADKKIAESREEYLRKRKELFGERATQLDSGNHLGGNHFSA